MPTLKDFIYPQAGPHPLAGLAPHAASVISEMAVQPISRYELAVGQRIQDALARALEMTGISISRDAAHVYFRNGVLTLDYAIDDRGIPVSDGLHHRRAVLGNDNKATFMDYDATENGNRKVTAVPHFASSDNEKNLESIMVKTKNFAIDAQGLAW